MTVEQMKEIKRAKGYTYEQIAELSGVPLGTVQKIFSGETQAPRYSTLQALEAVFSKNAYIYEHTSDSGVKEAAAVYQTGKKPGEYTVEDYYALPDDRRVELIDGVIYDMSSPTFVHQGVVEELFFQIADYIRRNKGDCIVKMAPMDVRLDGDDKTIVQPDLMIVCDKSKIKRWGIMGAPDFVVEVLSKATRRKDCYQKLAKYTNAGVKEYWIIDPENRKLLVYYLEEDKLPALYGLTGKVPIEIYQGKLLIDLTLVAEGIQEYPE